MRSFILKTTIITAAIFFLFQLTIGYRVDNFSKNIKSLTNQHERIKIKTKILEEINKGNKKDYLFSIEEREILSRFINKILIELNLTNNKS